MVAACQSWCRRSGGTPMPGHRSSLSGPATGTWASHSANEYARRFRSRSQMRRSRTSSTRAPWRSGRPPALSTERLSRSRMEWWSCSAGGGQRRCPRQLRAQDQVDHRVKGALGSSCRIAASSKRHRVTPLRRAPLVPSAGYCAGVVGGERDSASAVALSDERYSYAFAADALSLWTNLGSGARVQDRRSAAIAMRHERQLAV